MQIIDEWRNANGERVALLDSGDLQVQNTRGEVVMTSARPAVVPATQQRAVMATQRSGTLGGAASPTRQAAAAPAPVAQNAAVAAQLRAYEEEVKAHPGLRVLVNERTGEVMAACLEPVPYFAKQ